MPNIKTLSFTLNTWEHLYSLQQAIKHDGQFNGQTLFVKGSIKSTRFLNAPNTLVSIDFLQTEDTPIYKTIDNKLPVLGEMHLNEQEIQGQVHVSRRVFDELRKNLLEYIDIEGIHIIVTLGIACDTDNWPTGTYLPLVQLDYAMRGDA